MQYFCVGYRDGIYRCEISVSVSRTGWVSHAVGEKLPLRSGCLGHRPVSVDCGTGGAVKILM